MRRDPSVETHLNHAMRELFGSDQRRINHALNVLQYALEIYGNEGGDQLTIVAAAILHDIGIHEAERVHGSSAGRYQEIEGPPIARRIMMENEMDESTIDHVCRIIANHHSARDIDTLEFRILWDADWLVNLADEKLDKDKDQFRAFINKIFKTKTGTQIALQQFA